MRQQSSAWNSKDSNHMQLQLEQNCSFIPSGCTENPAFSGQRNGVAGAFQVEHRSHTISYPSCNPCLRNFPRSEIGVLDASSAPRKRFLIFDRSGNVTRSFLGPSFPCQKSIVAASEAPSTTSALCGTVARGVHHQFSVKPVVEEKWDENDLNDGEGEMLEDAEEINALLYSDSDYEYDDDDDDDEANDGTDSENDEVSSTRYTPFSFEDWQNKGKSIEKVVEQVVNGDGSPKRRKLLDGSCKKSSLHNIELLVKVGEGGSSCNCEDVVAYSGKNKKKVKIHKALEILGSIIPGSHSKDPLSIIERAIVYLETTKIEAEALGIR